MQRLATYSIATAFAAGAQSFFGARGDATNWILQVLWGAVAIAFALDLVLGYRPVKNSPRARMVARGVAALCIALIGVYAYFNSVHANIEIEISQNDLILVDARWIRFSAYNTDAKEASCRAYLTRLEKLGASLPKVPGSYSLQAADLGDGDRFQPVLIAGSRVIARDFDVALVVQTIPYMKIASIDHFDVLYPKEHFTVGVYEFDIVLAGTNCIAKPTRVKVDYRGGTDITFTKR